MSEERTEYKIEGRPATIFRTIHDKDNPYVMIDRRIIDNTGLSFKAKGILTYLLSRPDGWEVNLIDLANRGTDGIDAVKSGVKELKDAGYLRHSGTRKVDGQFGTVIWEVYEVPQVDNPLTDTPTGAVSPQVEKPQVEKPQVEKPQVDNPRQVLKNLSIKELSNNSTTSGEIFRVYQSNIGVLTPFIADELQDLEADYSQEWVILAIKEAVRSEARNLKYVAAILKRWKVDGLNSPKKNIRRDTPRQGNGLKEFQDELQEWVDSRSMAQ
jgi:DnaD/phage-associated family protein